MSAGEFYPGSVDPEAMVEIYFDGEHLPKKPVQFSAECINNKDQLPPENWEAEMLQQASDPPHSMA